ncbi:MAG: LPXTG cell wall anchor domain-containing protein [Actinomycetaceae bacterium]|nr:LPXTG cell wall anchor domain-containing protein [Actinomycetaceae bacterium]
MRKQTILQTMLWRLVPPSEVKKATTVKTTHHVKTALAKTGTMGHPLYMAIPLLLASGLTVVVRRRHRYSDSQG